MSGGSGARRAKSGDAGVCFAFQAGAPWDRAGVTAERP